jgi:hypothetical protein
MTISYRYPGKAMVFEMRIWNPYAMDGVENGVAVYGTDGMVTIGRWNDQWGYKLYDAKGALMEHVKEEGDGSHQRNFIDCIKSRALPNADIEIGHLSTLHAHLGNIAGKLGRTINFDKQAEAIPSDPEASGLLGRQYRDHWAAPKGV